MAQININVRNVNNYLLSHYNMSTTKTTTTSLLCGYGYRKVKIMRSNMEEWRYSRDDGVYHNTTNTKNAWKRICVTFTSISARIMCFNTIYTHTHTFLEGFSLLSSFFPRFFSYFLPAKTISKVWTGPD
jgi:hypothetical protein